ncbi:hypothetical protein CDAR_369691 [Caerostris darwini]|uniref:Uncharacterized protein n=1 Tax=Caerostris darwini TaxID=1538125 RepID=A0AAV4M3D1_9ARAC|nr:hypothetical protein CDAR_369691 [Caerostris darwini]
MSTTLQKDQMQSIVSMSVSTFVANLRIRVLLDLGAFKMSCTYSNMLTKVDCGVANAFWRMLRFKCIDVSLSPSATFMHGAFPSSKQLLYHGRLSRFSDVIQQPI